MNYRQGYSFFDRQELIEKVRQLHTELFEKRPSKVVSAEAQEFLKDDFCDQMNETPRHMHEALHTELLDSSAGSKDFDL